MGTSCAQTAQEKRRSDRTWAVVGEILKATMVSTAQTVICTRIEARTKTDGGSFDVPKGACRRSIAPNGNLVFSFQGRGYFSQYSGLARGEFLQDAEVEYRLQIVDGYAYVVPVRVVVQKPQILSLSLMARLAESTFGKVSRDVHEEIAKALNTPRTIIPSLGGRLCVVQGWVAPRSVPVLCGAEGEPDSFAPRGGYAVAAKRVPSGWDTSGLDLTRALVAVPLPPVEDSVVPEPDSNGTSAPPLVRRESMEESSKNTIQTSPLTQPSEVAPPPPQEPEKNAPPQAVEAPPIQAGGRLRAPLVSKPYAAKLQDEEPDVVANSSNPPTPSIRRSLAWPRADERRVRAFVVANGDVLADTIQRITHPAGRRSALRAFDVRTEGDVVAVEFEVTWSGRVAGSTLVTKVIWEFERTRHIRSGLLSDTSDTPIPDASMAELDAYFRAVHPSIGD